MSAFTDLYTNRVSQDILALPDALVSLNQTNSLPLRFLPTALHEYTHHWCFSLPVGIALGAVRHRLDEALVASEEFPPENLPEIFNMLSRYAVALKLLDPIVEGLALFAEFESLPGPSPSASQVYLNVLRMFRAQLDPPHPDRSRPAGPLAEHVAWMVDEWRRVLGATRRSDEWVRAKQNLCYRSLLDDASGAYLLGHLMLRAFHRRAAMRAPAFADSEFFLGFAAHVFFSDLRLAVLLLEPSPGMNNRAWEERLRDHLLARAACFNDARLEELASRYEQALLGEPGPQQSLRIAETTLGSPDDVATYRRLLLEDYQLLPADEAAGGAAGPTELMRWRRTMVRPLLRVAAGQFTAWRRGDSVDIELDVATPSVTTPQFVNAPPLADLPVPVRVALYFDPGGRRPTATAPAALRSTRTGLAGEADGPAWLLGVYTLDGRLVGQSVHGPTAGTDPETQRQREILMGHLGFLDAVDDVTSVWGPIISEIEHNLASDMRAVYAAMAADALELDMHTAGRCLESMRRLGLVGLLDGDDLLAGELVLLSVGSASGLEGGGLAAWLDDRGVDLNSLLGRAQREKERLKEVRLFR
jgi:hypothetical protein